MNITAVIYIGACIARELSGYVMDKYLNAETFLFLRKSDFEEWDTDLNGWPSCIYPVLVPDELISVVADLHPNKTFSHAIAVDNVFSVRNIAIACDYAWKWLSND